MSETKTTYAELEQMAIESLKRWMTDPQSENCKLAPGVQDLISLLFAVRQVQGK